MTAKKRRKSEQPSPDINVTPLVDVVLVLLIIFMVMMPALNEGAAVELPRVMSVEPEPELEPINVTFAYNGQVILNKRTIEREQLKPMLQDLHAADQERTLLLKFDERFTYEKARAVFKEIQDVGFGGISLKVNERKEAKGK